MDRMTGVCWGLFGAWVANDIEELVTMREDSQRALAAAPRWLPVPDDLRRQGVSQAHTVTAISIMGGLMAAAAAEGARTHGRSRLFQTVLLAFGLHGFGHLADAAWSRRWTSGARTSPTVVIPYWLWASRELRRAGTDPARGISWPMIAATPAILVTVHGAAWGIRRMAGVRRPLAQED